MGKISRPATSTVVFLGAEYPPFTGIIGRQRQMPVTVKDFVEFLQVVKRRLCCLEDITSSVVPLVAFQTEITTG